MLYFFGGVNGVGKTSLIKKIAENPLFESVHLTSLVMAEAGVSGYDELRLIDQPTKRTYLTAVMEELLDRPSEKYLLLDGHFLNIINGEITETTNQHWVDRLNGVILVACNPDIVMKRIATDKRDRALFAQDEKDADSVYREYIIAMKKRFDAISKNVPHTVVTNEASLEESVADFMAFHASVEARG